MDISSTKSFEPDRIMLTRRAVKQGKATDQPCSSQTPLKSKSLTIRTSSSAAARMAKLELEAAEAKAKIQMDLIDKKLAVEKADLEERCHSQSASKSSHTTHSKVEKWLESSQHKLNAQPAPDHGHTSGALCPPTQGNIVDTEGTVKMLASALKDLTAASASTNNAKLMSRMICNPRDLPTFEGDPMDWLQFKQAYDESTELCSYTPKENLWRLQKCLRGQAKEAVSALLISGTMPEDVMSTLELQFGNPDVILSKIMLGLKKMNPVSQDYIKDIVSFSIKVRNYVVAVGAIGRNEYLVATNVITNVLSKLPTVLLSKWADYSYPLIAQGNKPTLNTLSDFLTQEARKANSLALMNTSSLDYNCSKRKTYQEPTSTRSRSHNTVLVQQNEIEEGKCKFCYASKHPLPDCKKFQKAMRKQRWVFVKKQRLCFKCLITHHDRATCPAAACNVDDCGLLHHRLLHYPSNNNNNVTTPNNSTAELQPGSDGGHQVSGGPQEQQPESVTNINSQANCKVILKVVRINLHGPKGTVSAVALLDDGSTVSLINSALTSRLGLRGRPEIMCVSGAWNNNELRCETEVVRLRLSTCDKKQYELNVRSVKELNLPTQNLSLANFSSFSHLSNVKTYISNENVKPDLLIGQDNYDLIRPLEARVGMSNEPCATLTLLGWCVHGRVPVTSSRLRHSTLLIQNDGQAAWEEEGMALQQLHDEVRNSFTIESMGISGKPRQNAEDLRAIEQLEKSAVLKEGRWHVGLPWRDPNCRLPDSEPTALRRFKNVEHKISLKKEYAQRYQDRVNHLFDNGFAEEVTDLTKSDKTWYLPHFGVDNPNKKKLRLVFDAAAKSKGLSLNDYLLTGPDLLVSLFGIMLRFREHKVAIAGDIKDMFLRIKILPQCQDALRFVWRDHVSSPIKTYKMTSLVFGASCSPFIAQFIKNKNAQRYQKSMPSAAEAICRQHYMDDYIDSQPDTTTCINLAQAVSQVHQSGGFVICNWLSNSAEVLNSLPNDKLATNAHKLKIGQPLDGERALGLLWFPDEDTLGFDVSFKRIPEEILNGRRPTKREALRVIMSIFDVYGFLSPFTINGKIILQQTWISKIGWDVPLDDDIYEKWLSWLKALKLIGGIRLPRCYQSAIKTTTSSQAGCLPTGSDEVPSCYSNLELHLFSDASTQGMCAVGYWRWTVNDEIKVAFVSSKCRVAPVKPTTVPRLELQAALMAARLAKAITSEHRIKPTRRYFWCDSTTVLQWVRNDKRTYKTFVAHRLGEIDELTNVNEWRYIPTALNVADIATRESYDVTVLQCEWFNGPLFLSSEEKSWPADIVQSGPETDRGEIECVSTIQTVSTYLPIVPEPSRFSSWLRLLRSTAAMLKFIDKCRRKIPTDDCTLMARAEILLIKYSQAQSFSEELAGIKAGKGVSRQSRLLTLSPICDEHDVLHANGRIDAAAGITLATKQPVILDGKNYISRLIVRHYHIKAGHGGQEMVVNELKQKYWITKLRPTVKTVASGCNLCRIRKVKPEIPRMGNLPAGRMAHHQRPFSHCGVDLFGPMEVAVGRHREKRYGVLFTCLTIRAVHVEIVHSMTTDSLLMALRRMAARRGWPGHIYSDNGTNLRGAHTELKKSLQELDEETLKMTASTYGTQWTFIPPVSPHWGGAWERLIRSVKTTLKVVLKERAPKDEVLITLLAEVENIVNSRPLSHVSVEPGTKESLTPNHFLLGTSSNLPLLGVFDDSDLYLRKQWRKSQALADMFWRRWVREVLPDMIPRQKWHDDQDQQALRVGDLVFVADPDSPRCVWPRGIIQEIFPGKDGRVRLVAVRTQTGIFKRSAARVAKLSTFSE